jgi:hypothetical protein
MFSLRLFKIFNWNGRFDLSQCHVRALFPQVKLSVAPPLPPAIAKSALHKAAVRNTTLGVGITGVPLAAPNLPSAPKDGFANNEVAVNRHQPRRRLKKNMGTHVHKLSEFM